MAGKTSRSVTVIAVGPMQTNCYIVADPVTREALVIDPGSEGQKIQRVVRSLGVKVLSTVNTHGHADHIGANKFLGYPVMIHKLDAEFLTDTEKNLSASFGIPIQSPEASRILQDGDLISFGESSLEVIHTPGHTPGGVSLRYRDIVFCGDTLFYGSVGRTDFPYGDEAALIMSIKERLLPLGDEVKIFTGHGPETSIGQERRINPFL